MTGHASTSSGCTSVIVSSRTLESAISIKRISIPGIAETTWLMQNSL
jgi:hypothetical protein